MAMGHKDDEQDELFVTHAGLRKGGGHPFYEALEKLLRSKPTTECLAPERAALV